MSILNDLYDNIYLVNLKRRNDRRVFMDYKLSLYNIKCQLVEGIDGANDKTIQQLYEYFLSLNLKPEYKTSAGAIAIIFTFRQILKDAIDKKYSRILILEDDIIFHKNFDELLKSNHSELQSLHENYPIVYLGANQTKWTSEQTISYLQSNYDKDKISPFPGYETSPYAYTNGTFAVAINESIFHDIQKELSANLYVPIDHMINIVLRQTKQKAYVIHPGLIVADVCESDNMGQRNMTHFCKQRKWDLNNYYYMTLEAFYNIFNDIKSLSEYIKTKIYKHITIQNHMNILGRIYKLALNENLINGINEIQIDEIIEMLNMVLDEENVSLRQILFYINNSLDTKLEYLSMDMFNNIIYDYNLSKIIDVINTIIIFYNVILDKDITIGELFKLIEKDFKPFVFVVPSYNNANNYIKNLGSIYSQKYKHYRVLYMDDKSEDDTMKLCSDYISEKRLWGRTRLFEQYSKQRQCAGRFICYHLAYDDEVLLMLDGDDWLYDENVLGILNDKYNEYGLKCSYGSYHVYSDGKVSNGYYANEQFPDYIIRTGTYRYYKWISSHLRTGYASLFKNIELDDLLLNGKFYEICTDLAEFYPVLEQADKNHRCINKSLYVYNKDNSINYDTSYFNRDKNEHYARYRKLAHEVIKMRKNYWNFKRIPNDYEIKDNRIMDNYIHSLMMKQDIDYIFDIKDINSNSNLNLNICQIISAHDHKLKINKVIRFIETRKIINIVDKAIVVNKNDNKNNYSLIIEIINNK